MDGASLPGSGKVSRLRGGQLVMRPGIGVPDRRADVGPSVVGRREDWRPRPGRERDALETGVVVDDVEPTVDRVAERRLDVRQMRVLGVTHAVVVSAVAVATVDGPLQLGVGQRTGRASDVVAAPDQPVRHRDRRRARCRRRCAAGRARRWASWAIAIGVPVLRGG